MSNAVLDYVRSKDPSFNEADDDDLTLYIGSRAPEFLNDEQFKKRHELVQQKREVEKGTPLADDVSTAVDYLAPAVYPLTARGLTETVGLGGRMLGGAAKGVFDVHRTGKFEAFGRERERGPIEQGIAEGIQGLGEISPAILATAIGIPAPAAFGAMMGATTFSRTGDVSEAAKYAGLGMAMGPVSELGSTMGGVAGSFAAKAGMSARTQLIALETGKIAGSQSMLGALMVAAEGEHFLELLKEDPEKAKGELLKIVLTNLAFDLPKLPGAAREALAKDHVESYFKSSEYRAQMDELARAAHDPNTVQLRAAELPRTAEALPRVDVNQAKATVETERLFAFEEGETIEGTAPKAIDANTEAFLADALKPNKDAPMTTAAVEAALTKTASKSKEADAAIAKMTALKKQLEDELAATKQGEPEAIQPPTVEAVPETKSKGVAKSDEPPTPAAETGAKVKQPWIVTRTEEIGTPFSDPSSKPQGLYLDTKETMLGGHLGGESKKFVFSPSTPLDVTKDTRKVSHQRFGYMSPIEPSAGIKALHELVGEHEFSRLLELKKSELRLELEAKFPNTDWSRYFDSYEMLEGYAGLLARLRGHDSIIDVDEVVALVHEVLADYPNLKPTPAAETGAKVETDPARRQEIANSIAEGEGILKSGRNIAGRKLTEPELDAVRRSVDNSRAKLGDTTAETGAKGATWVEQQWDKLHPEISYKRALELEGVTEYPRQDAAWFNFEKLTIEEKRALLADQEKELVRAKAETKLRFQQGKKTVQNLKGTDFEGKSMTEHRAALKYERAVADKIQKIKDRISTPTAETGAKGKQRWEMTRKELLSSKRVEAVEKHGEKWAASHFDRKTPSDLPRQINLIHRSAVEAAIREGKPVPPEVLADYPDLAPTPAAETGAKGKQVVGISFEPKYEGSRQQTILVDGKPLGEVMLGDKSDKTLKLEWIRIDEAHRGKEIGKNTIAKIFNDNPDVEHIVGEAMDADMGYWRKLGANTQDGWFRIKRSDLAPTPAAETGAKGQLPGVGETQGAISTQGPPLSPAPSTVPSLAPKSMRQIITDLAKGLELPIRFGRLRTTKLAGYFQKVQNLIGSKKANDISIVSHEVGHKLDAVFRFVSNPALRGELDALGDPSMPGSRSSWTSSKSPTYKRGEGVAEFVRHWLIDPPAAAKHAPNMLSAFNAALDADKDFGDTMRQAQHDIQTWRNAPAQARLESHISVGGNPNKTPYTFSQLTRDLVDDLHFLRLAVDDAKSAGSDIPPSKNPYTLARNLRGSYGMADSFIRTGVADFKTKSVKLGTSLEDALKPVAGRIKDFRAWIVAKRAQELHGQGRSTGLVDSDVQTTAARFDHDPDFQSAFAKVSRWQDGLLNYAVDSGLVTAEGAKVMRQMNQDYVPFHRVFEVGAGEPSSAESGGSGRGLNVGTPASLKRLKGSARDIVDPLETMIKNAYTIITASEKHAINLAVAELSRKRNMGRWVEHIATPKENVKVGLEKLREQLEDAGADLTAVPDDLLLSFFQNGKTAPFGENIIKVIRDGKPEFYRLNKDLFDTFHALDLEDSGTLIRMLSAPTQLLRAGVTVAPDFALANALRDAFSSAIVSRHGLLPFEGVVRGVKAMLSDPKLIAEWEAAGGRNSIEANYFDRAKLQQFLTEKITKDMTPSERAWIVTKSPLQALRWLTSLSEEATRIGEYQKAFNDMRRGGMPEGDARRQAAFESRDRQDFAKGGAKTKIVRRLAAFWNAGVQGNVRLAQAFHEQPVKTTLKGIAFITLAKLAEQKINWNDEDYWDRPQWQRDLFFMIPAGKDASGHTRFVMIPTPFEAGIIFGTLPGRILQTIKEKNTDAAKTFPMLLAKQTIANPTPQWAMTLFESFLVGDQGWSVFRQRPIVPDSLKQLPPEMQWTSQTSLTARKLGEALGFSPMKIDHIINSTTGGLGKETTHQIVDRAIAAATGDARTSKGTVPGGRFVSTPASVSSQAVDDFYSTLDKIRTADAENKLGKANPLAGWLPIFDQTERDISELRKAMRATTDETTKNVYAEAILLTSRTLMKAFKRTNKSLSSNK